MFYVELVSILGKYLVDVLAKYLVQYLDRNRIHNYISSQQKY